jgi:beta-lactamase regulating signal transducer with metallopeptidase domain
MNDLLIYLLKVSAGSILLYLTFLIFYRNDTFYLRNRIILILSMALPVLIPLLSFTILNVVEPTAVNGNVMQSVMITGTNISESVSGTVSIISYSELLFWLWVLVAGGLIIRTVSGIVRTLHIIRKGERVFKSGLKIVISDINHPPFSFYPYAVIPRDIYEKGNSKEIITHEEIHIRQMHTFDLMISELFIAVFWFNPVSWLIRKSIVLNHEYLADNATIHKSISIKEYQYMLLNIPAGLGTIPLAHSFNSDIKNRIVMINRKPTNRLAALKNFLFLPAVLIIFLAFSFKNFTVRSAQQLFQGTVISENSKKEILRTIMENIKYPPLAKDNNDTGVVYLVMYMGNGGLVKKMRVYMDDDKGEWIKEFQNIQKIQEVVVSAYGSSDNSSNKLFGLHTGQLREECIRVGPFISGLDLPEWKTGDTEFVIPVRFKIAVKSPSISSTLTDTVKQPGLNKSGSPSADIIYSIKDPSEIKLQPGEPRPLIIVDGLEKKYEDFLKMKPVDIRNLSVLKGLSATKKYGEKANNGVIVVETKK